MRAPPVHRATTANLQAIYPFVSDGGLGSRGPFIGRDLLGGAFSFDPWDLYRTGALSNPNVLVIGQIGRGKSTFVKTLVWRQLAFGRRAWIIDPKGEYGDLAEAAGTAPVRLRPGGDVRLNPMEPATGGSDRRPELLAALAESSLGRRLSPVERTAIELAVRAATSAARVPTLADALAALLEPDPDLARTVRTDAASLAADSRAVALELRRLVEGDLAGLFDGPTSPAIDLNADVVTFDLSNAYSSSALPLITTCAASWLQETLARSGPDKHLIVVDEAWAVLRDLATARWLQRTFKLSRAFGVANVAVVHRLSDLRAAGADGSAEQHLAEGLLADSETRVVFGLAPSEAESTRGLLGLTATEAELVTHLPRGVALWKVGSRSFVVEHAIGRNEVSLVDTDSAMRDEESQ